MESFTGRMVRKRQQKGEGNGESHRENGKEKTAERGGKWRVARGEW